MTSTPPTPLTPLTLLTALPPRLILAASGWLALAATALPDGSPLRVTIAFAFMLVCPGAAVVRLAAAALERGRARRTIDPLEAGVLTVAVSLAIGALVGEAFFLSHSFTTTRAIVVLAAITSAAALCPIPRRRTTRG